MFQVFVQRQNLRVNLASELKTMTNQLDHIVIAHPDLNLAIEEFADLTGCKPAYGGPHIGGGTHNALASLGDSVYLELISPDPAQINERTIQQASNLGQRIATFEGNQLLAWAIRSGTLDEMAGDLHGFETASPFDMSRKQPDGLVLDWRLMNLRHHELKGFAPFFIDWLSCPHPAGTNPVAGKFVSLKVSHPDPRLGKVISETEGVNFVQGAADFVLEFESPRGTVVLSDSVLEGFWP